VLDRLNYPVKKFKPSDIEQKPSKMSNSADIYPPVQPPADSPPINGLPGSPGAPVFVKADVKQEPMVSGFGLLFGFLS